MDLVLMDVQMPVMDGIEATRQLRRLPQFNDLPIVALTAGAFKSEQEAAYAAGMTDFISKPFDVPATIALIQRLRRPSAVPLITTPRWRLPCQRVKWLHRPSNFTRRGRVGCGARPSNLERFTGLPGLFTTLCEPVLAKGYDSTLELARLGNALERAVAQIEQFAPLVVAVDAPVADKRAAVPGMAGADEALKTRLIELLAALDTDNPAPAKSILTTLEKQLPQLELSSLRASGPPGLRAGL